MHLKELLRRSFAECSNIIFPKICLHCKEKTSQNFFCSNCLCFFELLEKSEFVKIKNISSPIISSFEDKGPISTFIKELKKMALPALVKVAASYMVCQYLNLLAYPLPDIVVPIGENKNTFGIKYNDILAKEVAKLLKRPIKNLFFKTKIAMLQNSFFVKKSTLQKKRMLLITLKIEEQKVKDALHYLQKESFSDIYVLGLCH